MVEIDRGTNLEGIELKVKRGDGVLNRRNIPRTWPSPSVPGGRQHPDWGQRKTKPRH